MKCSTDLQSVFVGRNLKGDVDEFFENQIGVEAPRLGRPLALQLMGLEFSIGRLKWEAGPVDRSCRATDDDRHPEYMNRARRAE